MIALVALAMAAGHAAPALPECAGIVLRKGSRAVCNAAPPLVGACTALRACAKTGACVVTVTGRITASSYAESEAWGDWLDRLQDTPPVPKLSAATREGVSSGPHLQPPYTVIITAGRGVRVAPGLWLDDYAWLKAYVAGGAAPEGLVVAPKGFAAKLCPNFRR